MVKTPVRRTKNINLETSVMNNEIVQNAAKVEHPVELTEELIIDQPTESRDMEDNKSEDLTTEELLAAARKQAQAENPKRSQAENNGRIPQAEPQAQVKSEKSDVYIEKATAEAANKIIAATGVAKLSRIRVGIEEGIEEAKDIIAGRQIGKLLALAEATEIEAEQFSKQMGQLRSHIDTQTCSVVEQALLGMGFNLTGLPLGESANPLMGTVLAGMLPSRATEHAYQIFEMK